MGRAAGGNPFFVGASHNGEASDWRVAFPPGTTRVKATLAWDPTTAPDLALLARTAGYRGCGLLSEDACKPVGKQFEGKSSKAGESVVEIADAQALAEGGQWTFEVGGGTVAAMTDVTLRLEATA
jgi:hypothetical protein